MYMDYFTSHHYFFQRIFCSLDMISTEVFTVVEPGGKNQLNLILPANSHPHLGFAVRWAPD
jgi:hypothetical protein